MMVTADGNDHTTAGFDVETLLGVVISTLDGEGVERGHVDLFAVDADEMAELNRDHMGSDGPTDVLSFPLDQDEILGVENLDLDALGLEPHIGDIVLCPEVAAAQAPRHCGTVEAELHLLVIHGVLHLLGHDHAEREETVVMQAKERHHLARYGFAHPEPSQV